MGVKRNKWGQTLLCLDLYVVTTHGDGEVLSGIVQRNGEGC